MAKKIDTRLEMTELMGKSLKDLVNLRTMLKQELFDHKIKNSLRSLNKTHVIVIAKNNLARVQTAMTQKLTNHRAAASLSPKAAPVKSAATKIEATNEKATKKPAKAKSTAKKSAK